MINGLTPSDKRCIKLINSKLDPNDQETVDKLCKLIHKNDLCKSESGSAYLKELEEYRDTGVRQVSCIFCGKELTNNEFIVCEECLAEDKDGENEDADIVDTNNEDINIDIDVDEIEEVPSLGYVLSVKIERTKEKIAESLKKIFTPKVITLLICLLVIAIAAAIGGIAYFYKLHPKPQFILKNYRNVIDDMSYTVSDVTKWEPESATYTILPSGETLFLFNDEKGYFTGACLSLLGSDEVSRMRQTYLMSSLNRVIFTDITDEAAEKLVSQVAENNGAFSFDKYQVLLFIKDDSVLYYIIQADLISDSIQESLKNQENYYGVELDSDGTEDVSEAEVINDSDNSPSDNEEVVTANDSLVSIDGISLLGIEKSAMEDAYGEAIPLEINNAYYFANVGVSIVTDEDGKIIYLDEDGSGELGYIPVAGIEIGQDLDGVLSYLTDQGIEINESEDGNTHMAYVVYEEKKIRLTFDSYNDKVAIVSVTLIIEEE